MTEWSFGGGCLDLATMHDVARAAGVSQSAVSNAYNKPHKLSAARRAHILQCAVEIGYAGPNPAGRTLRTGQVGAMGLMLTDSLRYAFDDPSTALFLKGIAEIGESSEVALTLLPCPLESARVAEGSGALVRGAVDGFLAYDIPEGHPALDIARSRHLPVVIVDGNNPDDLPWVGIEDRAAARAIADHVMTLGHRRVGVLVDRLVPDGSSGTIGTARLKAARDHVMRERLAGYKSACRRHGIPWNEVVIVEAGGWDYERSLAAAETLLDTGHPSAVIAATDGLALATLDAAVARGLSVPRDLTVVGFDDIPAAGPRDLTTVRQPHVDKGRQSARLLLELVAGGPARQITLPTELVVRATSAAPPAKH